MKITNPIRSDGFGSQFQSIIFTAIYCELTDNEFVYTPFKSMEHNYDNDPDFIKKKEKLINFIGNFPMNCFIPVPENIKEIDLYTINNYFELNAQKCYESKTLQKIRWLFYENKNINKDPNETYIAIHIRRPNKHDNRFDTSNIPDYIYLEIINKLRIYRNYKIHIFSQGPIENFKEYVADDIVLHLDEDIETTFINMVYADILITSKSSLSYIAALLNVNTIYYIPFWHSPLYHWNTIILEECPKEDTE